MIPLYNKWFVSRLPTGEKPGGVISPQLEEGLQGDGRLAERQQLELIQENIAAHGNYARLRGVKDFCRILTRPRQFLSACLHDSAS